MRGKSRPEDIPQLVPDFQKKVDEPCDPNHTPSNPDNHRLRRCLLATWAPSLSLSHAMTPSSTGPRDMRDLSSGLKKAGERQQFYLWTVSFGFKLV
jgi:hypothetical protein